jgi:hypothetical protein
MECLGFEVPLVHAYIMWFFYQLSYVHKAPTSNVTSNCFGFARHFFYWCNLVLCKTIKNVKVVLNKFECKTHN